MTGSDVKETKIKKKSNMIDFTKGSAVKTIMMFYWPLLLTNMLQQLYNFADTLIV